MNDDLEMQLRATLVRHADEAQTPAEPFDPNRVTSLGLDHDGKVLAPNARRQGRWARAGVAAVAATVLVAVGVVAVNRNSPMDRPHDSRAAEAPLTAPPTTQRVGLDSLNGLFLATSTEFNGATRLKSWLSFATWAGQIGTNRCLSEKGFPVQPNVDATVPPWEAGANPSMRANTDFPDLAKLRAGTFVDSSTPSAATPTKPDASPTTVDTAVDTAAYNAAVDTCATQVENQIGERSMVATYVNLWSRVMEGIDSDAAVVSARTQYVACMADRGITVAEPGSHGVVDGDVFSLADQATRNGDTARVTQLAKAYGVCFAPVSDAMDAYRLAKRTEFYEQYKTQLEQLAVDIDQAETRISNEYGIPRP